MNMPADRPVPGMQQLVHRLRWGLAAIVRALGIYGLAALLVLLGVLVFRQLIIVGGARQLDIRQQAAIEGIAARPERAERLEVAEQQALPSADSFMAQLAGINALLQQYGFAHAEATYQQTDIKDMQLRRLVVEMPLRGRYPALRAVLDELAKRPGLRIEHLQLTRKSIGEEQLEIVLRFSLLGTVS